MKKGREINVSINLQTGLGLLPLTLINAITAEMRSDGTLVRLLMIIKIRAILHYVCRPSSLRVRPQHNFNFPHD